LTSLPPRSSGAQRVPSDPAASGEQPAALSRELAALLIEMSVALHKYTMYPDGHKLLDSAVAGVAVKLTDVLGDKPELAIGVARDQVIIDGAASDAGSSVLRDLARKLYRRRIGGLRLQKGIDEAELGEVFRTIARTGTALADEMRVAEGGGAPEGEREKLPTWPHATMVPLSFDHLEMGSEGLLPGEERPKERGTWASQLWLQLARATVSGSHAAVSADGKDLPQDPVVLARAIEARQNDPAFDKGILEIFPEFVEGIKTKGGMAGAALQQRISALFHALSPKALQRVVDNGSNIEQRRELLRQASQTLAADTVLDLVRAVAASEEHSMSESMLLLLSKMAKHAELGSADRAFSADSALRLNVRQLVDDWGDAATLPEDSYWETLEQLVAQPAAPPATDGSRIEILPEHVVRLAIDIDVETLGATGKFAIQDMVKRGQIAPLLRLVEAMPETSKIVYQLHRHLFNTGTIRRLLQDRPLAFDVLGRLVASVGYPAAPALLDALEREEDRKARDELYEMLAGLGPRAATALIPRLSRAETEYLRRLLMLLNKMTEIPPDFSAQPYAVHSDAGVRREAFALLLKDPLSRNKGIADGIADGDVGVNRLALKTASEYGCPRGAVPVLTRRLADRSLDAMLGATAVRVLAPVRHPAVLSSFVSVCLAPRRRFLVFRRLSDKSPVMIAALGALARGWASAPQAARVLKMAYRSNDPEIQSMLDTAQR
jgi:hypothetical protein